MNSWFARCISGLFFATCIAALCKNGTKPGNNFSNIEVLELFGNDTVPKDKIFCSPNVSYGKFPLHHGDIPHQEYVIGFYKRNPKKDPMETNICYYKKVPSLPDLVEVNTLTGGKLYTFGHFKCPPGFELVDIYCYFFEQKKQSFDAHNKNCIAKGGHLAKISDVRENTALGQHIKKFESDGSSEFMIGLKDMKGSNKIGDLKWIENGTESDLTYSNWFLGEPNDQKGEPCTVMRTHIDAGPWYDCSCTGSQLQNLYPTGHWFDATCDTQPAVCEIQGFQFYKTV